MKRNNSRNSIRNLTTAALVGSIGLIATGTMAQDEATPVTYPKFKTLRFDENWSKFDPAAGNDYWDDIKHHNLNNDGTNWVGMGGEFRYRTESWDGFGFSAATTGEDTFGLGRVQLHTDWHFGENFRIFIEGESAFATDRDFGTGAPRGIDVDQLDLQNAFADIVFPFGDSNDKVTFRLGRQGMSFGKQRLVSTLPWANSQRSWDGGRAIINISDWRIDAFYTRYTPWLKYQFNDWRLGPDFWGVYATGKLGEKNNIGMDLYYLGIEYDGTRTYNGTTGAEDRHTLGGRLFGKFGENGIAYDVEAAYQFGDVGAASINAYMFATKLSYAFKAEWKPTVYIGFDYSSGDDTAGDTDVETFNQLFPLGHAYNGFMDLIGRQNIQDLSAGFSFKPHKKFLVKADYHVFNRSSSSDSVYNVGGAVLRATAIGASDDVGQEIDITAKYLVDRHLTLQAGYSHFFAGDYFTDTAGGDEDIDFFYFQAVYKF